jgi:hypothetical protein
MTLRLPLTPLSLLLIATLWSTAGCSSDSHSSGDPDADADAAEPEDDEDASDPQDAGDAGRDAGDAGRADAGRRDTGILAEGDADAESDAAHDGSMDATQDTGAADAQLDTGAEMDTGSDAADGASGADADLPDAAETGPEAGGPDAAACPQCPGERCLPDGTCVECSDQLPCVDSALHCELTSHTCVECLPNPDTCPPGEYCSSGFQCVRGCKADGEGCASGRCDANHECERCIEDTECGTDRVCGTFACGVGCGFPDDPACGTGTECCNTQCVDTARDIEHCGGCNIACTDAQFCGQTGCEAVALGKLCSLPAITVVHSDQAGDLAESELLVDALEASCTPVPSITTVSQLQTELLNHETGRPLAGGNQLLATLGSGYANILVRYLETEKIAPVYQAYVHEPVAYFEYKRSSNDEVLLHREVANETPDHAHFLVQIVRDPDSGSLVVLAYGFWADGTAAARWFLANQVLPSLSSFTDTWYIYEWVNNAVAGPDAGDTFTKVNSG